MEYVNLVRDTAHPVRPTMGLGERLGTKANTFGAGPQRCAWLVACELARAYNGMLVRGGHSVALDSPDLLMKHRPGTGCTMLQPELLPAEVAGDLGWSAQVPQRGGVRYPAVMLGNGRRGTARRVVYLRMHRFVCWLARGPATAADHEVCHACSNSRCVRPSHLSWGSRIQNVRERAGRKRRR